MSIELEGKIKYIPEDQIKDSLLSFLQYEDFSSFLIKERSDLYKIISDKKLQVCNVLPAEFEILKEVHRSISFVRYAKMEVFTGVANLIKQYCKERI